MASNSGRAALTELALLTAFNIVIALVALKLGLLSEFEGRAWDLRVRALAKATQADPSIKIIVIDQSSIEHFSTEEAISWPWPRAMYEPVIRFLAAGKSRGVAFDMIFSEPSSYGREDDLDFVSAIERVPPFVSAVTLRTSGVLTHPPQAMLEQLSKVELAAFGVQGNKFPEYRSALWPLPELMARSALVGTVNGNPDSDGVFRRSAPFLKVGSMIIPSLPVALFRATNPGAHVNLARYFDSDGLLSLQFHGVPRTYKTYGIASIIRSWQLLQSGKRPLIDPREFDGALVLVGADAPGLLDLRPTPLAETYPGVEFHATFLDNLLHNQFFRISPQWFNQCLIIGMVVLALSCAVFPKLGWQKGIALTLGGLLAVSRPESMECTASPLIEDF